MCLLQIGGKVPAEEKMEDKASREQLKLINELEPEDIGNEIFF